MTVHRLHIIGDSESYGGTEGGPRAWLYLGLRALGYRVEMVGGTTWEGRATPGPWPVPLNDPSSAPTTSTPWPYTGYGWDEWLVDAVNGRTIGQVESNFAAQAAAISPALTSSDTGLFLCGGNNVSSQTPAQMATALTSCLATIAAHSPAHYVCAGPYAPSLAHEATRAGYVALMPGVVAAAGSQFSFAPVDAATSTPDVDPVSGEALPDGYRKAAAAWIAALVALWGPPTDLPWPRRFTPRASPAATLQLAAADHVQIPYSAAITPTTGSFWVAFWVMPAVEDGTTRSVFQFTRADWTKGCTLLHLNATLKTFFQGGGSFNSIVTGGYRPGRWNRVVLVGDAPGLVSRIHINGVRWASGAELAWSMVADSLTLGRSVDFSGDPGFFSDLQIGSGAPDKYAIEADYIAGTVMPGIVCRYRLDEGTGSSVADSLGVGAAGTITGGTWSTTVKPPPGRRT